MNCWADLVSALIVLGNHKGCPYNIDIRVVRFMTVV
jgi:hypothetical protein